jgi:hypothetical protein
MTMRRSSYEPSLPYCHCYQLACGMRGIADQRDAVESMVRNALNSLTRNWLTPMDTVDRRISDSGSSSSSLSIISDVQGAAEPGTDEACVVSDQLQWGGVCQSIEFIFFLMIRMTLFH